jgi:8-oxo-dGTP diphosphatase
MKKKRKFCSYCGNDITSQEQDGKLRDYCSRCKTFYYENPLPVASTIVVNENREVLLVKRKKDPYKTMWCLPIGFAESGEDVSDAALRELKEEAGINGAIVRLIDVDTVDNDFYGSLAIVTYEVRMTGGYVRPGDDASDAKYFPILDLPELAWSSNTKAINIYRELFKDTWAMIDSFRELYPQVQSPDLVVNVGNEQKHVLSNILIKILKIDYNEISENWSREVVEKIPSIKNYISKLVDTNIKILSSIQMHLQGDIKKDVFTDFIATGKELKKIHLPLPELITAMALSRKSIWMHVMMKKILASPLEIYTTLELNNRIIFIYDKIIYFLAKGYN